MQKHSQIKRYEPKSIDDWHNETERRHFTAARGTFPRAFFSSDLIDTLDDSCQS